jgi:hypothetical protein
LEDERIVGAGGIDTKKEREGGLGIEARLGGEGIAEESGSVGSGRRDGVGRCGKAEQRAEEDERRAERAHRKSYGCCEGMDAG